MSEVNLAELEKSGAAKVFGKGNFFKSGRGRLVVDKILYEVMFKGPTFVAEFVVESSSAGDVDPRTQQKVDPNAPGSKVSFVQNTQKQPEVAPSEIKAFVLALTGYTSDQVDGQKALDADKKPVLINGQEISAYGFALYQLKSKEQPMRGAFIDYECIWKQKKNKEWMNVVKWSHVDSKHGNSPAEIAERRSKMTGG